MTVMVTVTVTVTVLVMVAVTVTGDGSMMVGGAYSMTSRAPLLLVGTARRMGA